MRRALVVAAGLIVTASAHAAPPAVVASASGDAASYTWELGDGTTAAGPEVRHVYGPGRFVATVTATSSARAAAIHGYPSVPAYPASHGCVRVPMWIAPSLFEAHGYRTMVLVRP